MKNPKILAIAKASILFSLVSSTGFLSLFTAHPVQAQNQTRTKKAPEAIDKTHKFKFASSGCQRREGTEVKCDVVITNMSETRSTLFFTGQKSQRAITTAIDSSGNVYTCKQATSGNEVSSDTERSSFAIDFAPGIPTKVTFDFDIPNGVNLLSAIDVGYVVGGFLRERIAVPNVNITAASASTEKSNSQRTD